MKYYYLIAGLPDIHLDNLKDVPSMDTLKIQLEEQLTDEDMRLVNLIYAKYDNKNLLAHLKNKDAELNPLGSLKSNDWKDLTMLMEEHEHVKDARFLPYIQRFYSLYHNEEFSFEGVSHEDYIAGLYYEYAMQNNNKFLRDWFEFNLNLSNVFTAIAARKYDFDLQNLIIGNNKVAETLRKNTAANFRLKGIHPELEKIIRIVEEKNLLTREKLVDDLKWSWLDEHTFFNYFTIERVLAFILKCELINRWKPMSQEEGTQIFRNLLDTMKKDVKFEEE